MLAQIILVCCAPPPCLHAIFSPPLHVKAEEGDARGHEAYMIFRLCQSIHNLITRMQIRAVLH